MARAYAGVLGVLAFTTITLRGSLIGGNLSDVTAFALWGMAVFAVIGALLGQIADTTVRTSVRDIVQREVEECEKAKSNSAEISG